MDWNLNISIGSPVSLLAILGAALIAAGVVAYRGSGRTGVRAFAAAMVAAGVTAWALIVYITPVLVTSGAASSPILSASSATPSPVSPISTATQTTSPTAVSTGGEQAEWKLYQNKDFEFRYPVACPVTQSDGAITVGGRIELVIADARGLAIQDYVSQFIDERTRTSGWKFESQQAVTLGANQGIRVDYRFGGTNRFGTAVFTEQGGKVYIWD